MLRTILILARLLTFVCYSIYALSPLCATVSIMYNVGHPASARQPREIGILWLTVVIDTLTDDASGVAGFDERFVQATRNHDIVLVKKKCGVVKKHDFKHAALLESTPAQRTGDEYSEQPAVPCAVPHDLIHRHADGYYSRSTGLSPPFPVFS